MEKAWHTRTQNPVPQSLRFLGCVIMNSNCSIITVETAQLQIQFFYIFEIENTLKFVKMSKKVESDALEVEFEDSLEIKEEPIQSDKTTMKDEGNLIFQIQKLLEQNEQFKAEVKTIPALKREINQLKLNSLSGERVGRLSSKNCELQKELAECKKKLREAKDENDQLRECIGTLKEQKEKAIDMAEEFIKGSRVIESKLKDGLNIASSQCLVLSKEIEELRSKLAKSESQEQNHSEEKLLKLQELKDFPDPDYSENKGVFKEVDRNPKVTLPRIIRYFRTNKYLREYLVNVIYGKVESERHNLAMSKNYGALEKLANSDFYESDRKLNHELYVETKKIVGVNHGGFLDLDTDKKYDNLVMIPEGTIFYLIRTKKMSREQAEKYYLEFNKPDTPIMNVELVPEANAPEKMFRKRALNSATKSDPQSKRLRA